MNQTWHGFIGLLKSGKWLKYKGAHAISHVPLYSCVF